MCLLSIAGKGTNKNSEELFKALRNGAVTNTDGMGYTFKRDSTKKVFLSKGFYDVELLIRAIQAHRLKDNDELIIHQRIGNKGAKNVLMCHPFVLAYDPEVILQNRRYVDLPVMAHNGTFHSFSKTNSEYSDTYWFIQEFMYKRELVELMQNDLKFFKDIFSLKLQTNKLGFLFPNCDNDLVKIGDFKEHSDGYFFSNDSYKDKSVRDIGGSTSYWNGNYGRGGEDWDWDNDDYAVPQISSTVVPNWVSKSVLHNNQLALPGITNDHGSKYKLAKAPEDIVLESGTAIECKKTYVKFRLYMDMWIPEKYIETCQYPAVRWNPTEFNYTELKFKALVSDQDMGVEEGNYYIMINYDTTYKRSASEGLHVMKRLYSSVGRANDPIYVPGYILPSMFDIKPLAELQAKYIGYYRLCNKLSPSKTLLKKVNKYMDRDKFKHSEKHVLNFRNIEGIWPSSMSLYQMLLTKEVYKSSYKEEINKNNMIILV